MRSLSMILLCLLALGAPVLASPPTEGDAQWDDPEFKKRFLGDYGIHPDVEPKMSVEERALLERIYPLMSEEPEEAARQIATGRKPDSTALFDFVLGTIAYQQGQYLEAQAHYEDAVERFPSFRRAWRMLGIVEFRLQKPSDAIHAFTRMIQLGSGDALSYGLLGDAYSSRQDPLAAESAYRNALLLEPEDVSYRIALVRAVLEQQKYEEAIGLLRTLVEKHPERSEFLLLEASAYVQLKQPLRAAENYEVVARMGKGTPETMNVLGDIYVNDELPQLAQRAYERAIELDSSRSPTRPLRNVETLLARGATVEAAALAARFREISGEALPDDVELTLRKLEARIALAEGRGDDAARILEDVVAKDPLDGNALVLLGQHFQRAGDPEKAVLYYERAGSLEAFEAQAKARQGQLLASQGKYDVALPLLKRARELKPNDQLAAYIEQVERLARSAR